MTDKPLCHICHSSHIHVVNIFFADALFLTLRIDADYFFIFHFHYIISCSLMYVLMFLSTKKVHLFVSALYLICVFAVDVIVV